MVWDISRERRTPAEVAALAKQFAPWRLAHGRLMPRD
jgi:hypothetical protein